MIGPCIAVLIGLYATAPPVTFAVEEASLSVQVDGHSVARYVWEDDEIPRPYLRDLHTRDGHRVTRRHPPDPVSDRNNDDHADYHPGMWLAFGDIGGADVWRLKARVRHDGFVSPPESGAGMGSFAVKNVYESRAGEALCTETCRYTFCPTDAGLLITTDSLFEPTGDGFAFGDQEEMGLGIRLSTPLTVRHGDGTLVNSAGGRDEKGTWGKRADWCAGYGTDDGQTIGAVVMAHPDNFRPSWFHSRNYGLIVANPFGRKAMTGPHDDDVAPDATEVARGESFRLRFGVYVVDGVPDGNALYRSYVNLATAEPPSQRAPSPWEVALDASLDPPAGWKSAVSIAFDGRTVFQETVNGYMMPYGDGSGRCDLDGDGRRDLILTSFSGGAHCCFDFYVFLSSLPESHNTIPGGEAEQLQVEECDADGVDEVLLMDDVFSYWGTDFANSQFGLVAYQYVDGKRVPAPACMAGANLSNLDPDPAKLTLDVDEPRTYETVVGHVQRKHMRNLVAYLYAGETEKARSHLGDLWPEDVAGAEDFWKAFLEKVKTSRFYDAVAAVNGWV